LPDPGLEEDIFLPHPMNLFNNMPQRTSIIAQFSGFKYEFFFSGNLISTSERFNISHFLFAELNLIQI
jgi:hypothetical protein